jgi:hypothetical protein
MFNWFGGIATANSGNFGFTMYDLRFTRGGRAVHTELMARYRHGLYVDCGGKRSATPLSECNTIQPFNDSTLPAPPKAPSPLRSAGAVQDVPRQSWHSSKTRDNIGLRWQARRDTNGA